MRKSWVFATLVAATLAVAGARELEDIDLLLGLDDNGVINVKVEIPKECPKVDPINTTIHLAHEWDCTKFYMCAHGKRVLFVCPLMDAKGNRLHFNPVLQVCDWPKQAGCIGGETPTTTEGTTYPTTTKKTTRPTDKSTTVELSTESTTEITTPSWLTEPSTESTTKLVSDKPSTAYPTAVTTQSTTSKPWTEDPTDPTTDKTTSKLPIQTTKDPTSHKPPTDYPTKITTEFTTPKSETESPWEPNTEKTTLKWTSETPTESTKIPTSHKPSTEYPTKPTTVSTTSERWTEDPTEATDKTSKWLTDPTIYPTSHRPSTDDPTNPTTVSTTSERWTEDPTEATDKTSKWSTDPTIDPTSHKPFTDDPTKPTTEFSTSERWTEDPTEATDKTSKWSTDPTIDPTSHKPFTDDPTKPTTESSTSERWTEDPTETTDKTSKWSTDPTIDPTSHKPSTDDPTKLTTESSTSERWTEDPTETTDKTSKWSTDPIMDPTSHKPSTDDPTKPTTEPSTSERWTEDPTEATDITSKWPMDPTKDPTSPKYSTIITTKSTTWTHQPTEPTIDKTTQIWSTEFSSTGEVSTEPTVISTNPSTPESTEPSTPEMSTPEPSTPEASTPETSTPEPSTPEPSTPEASTPEASTPESSTPEPSTPEISTPEPSTPEPSTPEISTPEPSTPEISTPEPSTPEISTPEASTPEPSTPEISTPELSTPEPSTDTTPSSELTIPTDEVDQNGTATPAGIYVPHENNCSLFYEIVNDEKILKECPRGLHFSPTEKICLWPAEARCELQTSTDPAMTGACGDIGNNWVVAHECACNKYYLCSNGDLILKVCPEGLHFNPSYFECTDPESAGCESVTTGVTSIVDTTTIVIPTECPPDNSGQPVQLPHETNCSLYYKCDHGKKILQQCPNDLHFNAKLQICEWADSAGCISISTTIKSSEYTTNPTKPEDGTSILVPNECPPDNSGEAVHLPHPYNCSLFYKCDHGNKVLQSCPAGLEFNAAKQVCDWPALAGCSVSTGSSEDSTKTTKFGWETTPHDGSGDGAGTTGTIVVPTECPPDNSGEAVHLPHPYNCSLFYKCDHGKKILQSCPAGLEFNAEKQVCDWPELAGCSVSTGSSEDSIKTTKLGWETTHDYGSGDGAGSTETIVVPTECPPDNSGEAVHLPHPYNCSLFYKCDHGNKVLQSCPAGLEFNAEKQVCDWPATAGCVASTTKDPGTTWIWSTSRPSSSTTEKMTTLPSSTTEKLTTPPSSTTEKLTTLPSSTTDEVTTPPSSTTEKLTTLPSSTTEELTTPPSSTTERLTTLPSSTTEELTTPPSSTTEKLTTLPNSTTEGSTTTPICEKGSKTSHETNCSLYYECEEGKYELKECPPGLHFNPLLNICDWPTNVICETTTILPNNASSPIVQQSSSTVGLNITDDYVGQDTSSSKSTDKPSSPSSITTESGVPSCVGTCPAIDPTYAILLPNEDCTKFCQCSNGRSYVYDCPAKLHFNPIKRVCDYPRRAKCEGKGGYGHPKV